MRNLILLLFFWAPFTLADSEIAFLGHICMRGFEKTSMHREEAVRFCKCVEDDVRPQLNARQRATIRDARSRLERGQRIADDYFVSSGVRDLVVAGQARCEAAFYPPSQPIMVKGGQLELTMRCDTNTHGPELLIYIRDGGLLTSKEHDRFTKRMMPGNFDPDYAMVTVRVDARPPKTESWEIDVTGQLVSPPQPHALIAQLRRASSAEVTISRGEFRYQGRFALADRIPPRWTPCGGVASQ